MVQQRRLENMKINKVPAGKVAGPIPFLRLADDFQTPLGVIISAGEVLENYFDRLSPERRRLALEDILNAARQMNCTIDSLITFDSGKDRKFSRPNRRVEAP